MTGGGSGGHVTPLIAVAAELKKLDPSISIVFAGQRGDRFGTIVADSPYIDASHRIYAGKFRRYHGEGWRQVLDIRTMLLNLRDLFYFLFGIVQSLALLRRMRPDVVFVKGGFVGVPIGLAAAFWRVPYITHDSDAVPGLANRIIARWAKKHAVALPAALYKSYPRGKTVTTGVPIAAEYQHVTTKLQATYRDQLDLPKDAKIVLVTGGGLGSKVVNDAAVSALPVLLTKRKKLYVLHTSGQAHVAAVQTQYEALLDAETLARVQVLPFSPELHVLSGAADIVIARAGATNVAELAAQGVATIVVPSPFLAGGHQLRNAESLAAQHAVIVLDERRLQEDPGLLTAALTALLDDDKERHALGERFRKLANPAAAHDLAVLLLEVVKH